jgi:hypothetical protein
VTTSESEYEKRKKRKKHKDRKKKHRKHDSEKKKRKKHAEEDERKKHRSKRRRKHSDGSGSDEREEAIKSISVLNNGNDMDHVHEDGIYGPAVQQQINVDVNYGSHLLFGEGTAMAKYVQENRRIPRRGEIGLTSDQIEHFENLGYVMSGSRHRLMNAVRIRKENQVITAEKRRELALLHHEEKIKRENKIVAQFREMINNSSNNINKEQ